MTGRQRYTKKITLSKKIHTKDNTKDTHYFFDDFWTDPIKEKYTKMKNTIKTSMLMLGISVLLSTSSSSLPGLITYQGRLTDSVGNPITNTVEVTFTLWSAESGVVS